MHSKNVNAIFASENDAILIDPNVNFKYIIGMKTKVTWLQKAKYR